MLAPGLDLVAVTGDGLGLTIDAGLGAHKVKGDLLGALAAVDVVEVLVIMDTMCNRISL
jgi:hypothetical protein